MKEREEQRGKVKQSLFPVSLFGIYIGVLFLMSGIHTGLIVFMNSAGWNKAVMTVVPMCYWGNGCHGTDAVYQMEGKKNLRRTTV